MKRTSLILTILLFTIQCFSQKKSEEIYIGALNMHIKNYKTDTLIVQREIYMPEDLPNRLNGHFILFLGENEIAQNQKNLIKIHPMKVEDGLLVIEVTNFHYNLKNKIWMCIGSIKYLFKYDCLQESFVFHKMEILNI